MRKWTIVCGRHMPPLSYKQIILSEDEPDEAFCRSLAEELGCNWWSVNEEVDVDENDKADGTEV